MEAFARMIPLLKIYREQSGRYELHSGLLECSQCCSLPLRRMEV